MIEEIGLFLFQALMYLVDYKQKKKVKKEKEKEKKMRRRFWP
jgi:hypothetical protein